MNDSQSASQHPDIPPDDTQRHLSVARPDKDQALAHLGIVGDTYTILLTGEDTRPDTLIDMHVPPGGGPPPHRHDFEEMFTVLDGEVELTFRGEQLVARAGETVNVPANAPHAFTNASGLRGCCACAHRPGRRTSSSLGEPVPTRTEPPPKLDEAAQAAFIAKSQALAAQYRTECSRPERTRGLGAGLPSFSSCQPGGRSPRRAAPRVRPGAA